MYWLPVDFMFLRPREFQAKQFCSHSLLMSKSRKVKGNLQKITSRKSDWETSAIVMWCWGKLTHQQQGVTCECRHLTGPGLAVSICNLVTCMEPGVVHHEVWATPAERGIQRVELGTVMPTSKGSELRCQDTLTITPNHHAKQGTSPSIPNIPIPGTNCATLPLTKVL